MSPRLQEIFGELGISQYLDAFVDQGFDTWETILDITESDLDALGVKLGHRRKLQRRIANARGIAPNATLVSPSRASVEENRNDVQRSDALAPAMCDGRDGGTAIVQKRKYRRHPKPDENAPERPPSAYVLFSNKMREDLKGQNLTFTEIAKLVGENWQGLTQAEKEPYERQAQNAKEKYNNDLAEYKKTPEYKKYLHYLQEFKAKHGNQPQDKDNSKRIKLLDAGISEPSSMPNHVGRSGRTGSIGEFNVESPARQRRVDSIVSNGEPYYAPPILSLSQRTPGEESNTASPSAGYFERRREHSPGFAISPKDSTALALPANTLPLRRDPSYLDGARSEIAAPQRNLPSLSDMFDGAQIQHGLTPPAEGPGPGLGPSAALLPRRYLTGSPAPTPSASGSESLPQLKKEQSSGGSMSSGSSYQSYPRTPIEGPLPIHALLTNGKQFGFHDTSFASSPAIYRSMSPDDRGGPAPYLPDRTTGDIPASHPVPHSNGYYSGQPAVSNQTTLVPPTRPGLPQGYNENRLSLPPVSGPPLTAATPPVPRSARKSNPELDGITALLAADKIADRRPG